MQDVVLKPRAIPDSEVRHNRETGHLLRVCGGANVVLVAARIVDLFDSHTIHGRRELVGGVGAACVDQESIYPVGAVK